MVLQVFNKVCIVVILNESIEHLGNCMFKPLRESQTTCTCSNCCTRLVKVHLVVALRDIVAIGVVG